MGQEHHAGPIEDGTVAAAVVNQRVRGPDVPSGLKRGQGLMRVLQLRARRDLLSVTHVGAEHWRYGERAVRILIEFHKRDQDAG